MILCKQLISFFVTHGIVEKSNGLRWVLFFRRVFWAISSGMNKMKTLMLILQRQRITLTPSAVFTRNTLWHIQYIYGQCIELSLFNIVVLRIVCAVMQHLTDVQRCNSFCPMLILCIFFVRHRLRLFFFISRKYLMTERERRAR